MSEKKKRLWALALRISLILFFYLYVKSFISPLLIYHYQLSGFLMSDIGESILQLGGPVECLSNCLMQFYPIEWLGAILVVLSVLLACLCFRLVVKEFSGVRLDFLYLLPAVPLLVLQSYYRLPLGQIIGLAIALLLAAVYIRSRTGTVLARLILLVAVTAIAYWLSPGQCLLFLVLCGSYEIFRKGRKVLALASLVIAIGLIYISLKVLPRYDMGIRFWQSTFVYYDKNLPWASILLQGFLVICPVFLKLRDYQNRQQQHKVPVVSALVFAIILLVCLLPNDTLRMAIRVDYYAQHRMWDRALDTAEPIRFAGTNHDQQIEMIADLNTFAKTVSDKERVAKSLRPERKFSYDWLIFDVNRCLHHSGKMLSDMFSYPQIQRASSFHLHPEAPNIRHPFNSDIYIDLADFNLAERLASEALSIMGPQPWILQRLALIYALKGNNPASDIFLAALGDTPFQGSWYEPYLFSMDGWGYMQKYDFNQFRTFGLKEDYSRYSPSDELVLLKLLMANGKNQTAFEYLIAHYLINKDLDKLAENVNHLKDFGYEKIPRHYQEALLLYRKFSGRAPDLHGYGISPEILEAFMQFDKAVVAHPDDPDAAQKAVSKDFGNTYWYYFLFGSTFEPDLEAAAGEGAGQ